MQIQFLLLTFFKACRVKHSEKFAFSAEPDYTAVLPSGYPYADWSFLYTYNTLIYQQKLLKFLILRRYQMCGVLSGRTSIGITYIVGTQMINSPPYSYTIFTVSLLEVSEAPCSISIFSCMNRLRCPQTESICSDRV